jgi:hypothetical protein
MHEKDTPLPHEEADNAQQHQSQQQRKSWVANKQRQGVIMFDEAPSACICTQHLHPASCIGAGVDGT